MADLVLPFQHHHNFSEDSTGSEALELKLFQFDQFQLPARRSRSLREPEGPPFCALALLNIHQVPGVLIQLQLHYALFVNFEPASRVERALMFLSVFIDQDFHSC